MAKAQVIFYSMYGHVHAMAGAVADGGQPTADGESAASCV